MKYSKSVCYWMVDTAEGRELAEKFEKKMLAEGYAVTKSLVEGSWYVVGMVFNREAGEE